jgi:hypothetical protein
MWMTASLFKRNGVVFVVAASLQFCAPGAQADMDACFPFHGQAHGRTSGGGVSAGGAPREAPPPRSLYGAVSEGGFARPCYMYLCERVAYTRRRVQLGHSSAAVLGLTGLTRSPNGRMLLP